MRDHLGLRPRREKAASGPDRLSLTVPNLSGLGIPLTNDEIRETQRFAQSLIAAIEAWQHREKRRREGWRR